VASHSAKASQCAKVPLVTPATADWAERFCTRYQPSSSPNLVKWQVYFCTAFYGLHQPCLSFRSLVCMSFVHNILLPFSRSIVVEVPGRGGVGSNSAGDNKVDKVSVLGLKLAGHIKGWIRMICPCCVLFLPRSQGTKTRFP
jgi:hypothetical protein